MNRQEKLNLIMEEERNRLERERNELMKTRAILEGPFFGEEAFDEPFQFETVPEGAREYTVYRRDIPKGKAAVVTHIANEWYPRTVFEFKTDEYGRKVEKAIGDTENPRKTRLMAKDRIEWTVSNRRGEEVTVGIVTDGYYIPERAYNAFSDIYHEMESSEF